MARPDKSIDILKHIYKHQRLGPVTVQLLTEKFPMSRQAMQKNLDKLQHQNLIEARELNPKTLHYQVTGKAMQEHHLGNIPLVGLIAAGEPAFTNNDQAYERATYITDLIPTENRDYIIQVRGDSMSGIGILDGDYVIIRPEADIYPGDVVAVCLPAENLATLKRWYTRGEEVMLVSENPLYSPMIFRKDQVRFQGLMVGRLGGRVPRKSLAEALSEHLGDG